MTQREFEHALVKVCPTVSAVTYDRTLGKGKPFYNAVYVHWTNQENVSLCHLEANDDIFVAALNFFEELADAPK